MDELPEDEDFLDEPPDDWWALTPGRALHAAFSGFEHGILYYGLNSDQPPPMGLPADVWSRLRLAHSSAIEFARIAQQLLHPGPAHSLTTPSELTKGRKHYEQWNYSMVERMLGLEQDPAANEAPNLSNAAGAWQLYRTTFSLEMAKLLPGVVEMPYGDGVSSVIVDFDDAVHRRLSDLRTRLIRATTERAMTHLQRVSRCYIMGMREEFATMARAALEVYLRETRGLPDETQETLDNLIEQWRNQFRIPEERVAAAHRVRLIGNAAAHGAEFSTTAESLLADLSLAFG